MRVFLDSNKCQKRSTKCKYVIVREKQLLRSYKCHTKKWKKQFIRYNLIKLEYVLHFFGIFVVYVWYILCIYLLYILGIWVASSKMGSNPYQAGTDRVSSSVGMSMEASLILKLNNSQTQFTIFQQLSITTQKKNKST